MTNGRLQNKVAIVTGGASGIGEACSRIFVREGAKVIISDIDATKGNALEAELTPDAVFFNHDVTQEAAWDEAVEIAESKWDASTSSSTTPECPEPKVEPSSKT